VKKAAPKGTIYPTDIGCYTLGKEPPLEVADLLLCMGSNAGTACGLAVSTDQKIISFMGDSTFFHSGIPPIINAVHHKHDAVITILDNRTTAMTGHQPHPGTEFDGMGQPAKLIKVEDVVKGLGVEHIEIVDPNNSKETTAAFKRALDSTILIKRNANNARHVSVDLAALHFIMLTMEAFILMRHNVMGVETA